MSRRPAPDQLEAYRKQQVEIARKIKEAEAKKREKAKQDDLRRRLVLGSAALDYFSQPELVGRRAEFLKALFRDRKLSAADLALFKEMMVPAAETTAAGDAGIEAESETDG